NRQERVHVGELLKNRIFKNSDVFSGIHLRLQLLRNNQQCLVPGGYISYGALDVFKITPPIGGGGRDRTGDLHNAIVALSQLSYTPANRWGYPEAAAFASRFAADVFTWIALYLGKGRASIVSCGGALWPQADAI